MQLFMQTALQWVGAENDGAGLAGNRLGTVSDEAGLATDRLDAVTDDDLLEVMPALVQVERSSVASVVEHLMEIDRRRLYLREACSSLFAYCRERLGYSENESLTRVRAARAAARFPLLLDELRRGGLHLTAIFLLSTRLTEANHAALVSEARGKSKSQIEVLLARWFPKPDVPAALIGPRTWSGHGETGAAADLAVGTWSGKSGTGGGGTAGLASGTIAGTGETGASAGLVGAAWSGMSGTGGGTASLASGTFGTGGNGGAGRPTGEASPGRLRPLSESRWALQLTARAELVAKIEQARELLSHAVPSGDLAELIERAFDALLEQETKRRMGAAKPRKRRAVAKGSRHVPVDVVRLVWERDGSQCTFVDAQGRRCSARRFLTIEHRTPHACGGPPSAENLCLLCAAHNAQSARRVFGDAHIQAKIAERKRPCTRGGEGRQPAESTEPGGATGCTGAESTGQAKTVATDEASGITAANEVTQTSAPHEARERSATVTTATAPTQKVSAALRVMGFREGEIRRALAELRDGPSDIEALLRAALERLTTRSCSRASRHR